MGKVLRLHSDGKKQTLTFDLPIVPEHVQSKRQCCPHCNSHEDNSKPVDFIEGAKIKVTGDLMGCSECEQVYLVVLKPALLGLNEPIMTVWHVEDGIV